MKKTFLLEIYTPYGCYLKCDAEFLNVRSNDFIYGILPGFQPTISTLKISEMVLRVDDEELLYAIGGGLLNVKKEKVTLLLNSIERKDEIDILRAQESLQRAKERLENKTQEIVDVTRAKLALERAANRINIYNK